MSEQWRSKRGTRGWGRSPQMENGQAKVKLPKKPDEKKITEIF